jgi:hypothetical protein
MQKRSMLLLSALVVACTPAPRLGPAPMSAPMAAPMGFPVGTYTTTIVTSDIPASVSADMRTGLAGAWEIAFGDNGHAQVSVNGRQVVDAPFQVSGRDFTLGEDTGEYACHSPARYTWHATATELHLSRVEDSCDGRAVVLTAHPLVLRR